MEASSESNLYTLDELQKRMMEFVANDCTEADCYSTKRKLMERYGHHVFFAENAGRKNVLGFSNICAFIVNEKWLL